MKNPSFAVLSTVFVLASMLFITGCATPLTGASLNKHDSISTEQSTLIIKQVEVRGDIARIYFEPGAIKYVVESNGKQITLTPKEHDYVWNEGYLTSIMMSTFRSYKKEHNHDELWLSSRQMGEKLEVTMSCTFPDGAISTRRVLLLKGTPRVVALNDSEIILSLQEWKGK